MLCLVHKTLEQWLYIPYNLCSFPSCFLHTLKAKHYGPYRFSKMFEQMHDLHVLQCTENHAIGSSSNFSLQIRQYDSTEDHTWLPTDDLKVFWLLMAGPCPDLTTAFLDDADDSWDIFFSRNKSATNSNWNSKNDRRLNGFNTGCDVRMRINLQQKTKMVAHGEAFVYSVSFKKSTKTAKVRKIPA